MPRSFAFKPTTLLKGDIKKMKVSITGIAQDFLEEELRQVLDTDSVRKFGNYGFAGLSCSKCKIKANVPVCYIWTSMWTCTCGNNNSRNDHSPEWQLPWEDPAVGPSRSVLNRILDEIGLIGRKYAEAE